ncbi:Cell division protein kinase 1 [Tilletia horrida]|uniref:Cell division protein kinase 1 n=1 Tax=Tilletia horrida TaxID=155126 RepID=A0AAN6JHK3_9BASI|nr:Cell division protein kinase 1 [Tilletia horrida]
MPQIDADAIDFIDVNATNSVPARRARAGNVTSYKSLSQFTYLGFMPHLRKEAWQCKQCEQTFRVALGDLSSLNAHAKNAHARNTLHSQPQPRLPGSPQPPPPSHPPSQSRFQSQTQLSGQPKAQPQLEPPLQPQPQSQLRREAQPTPRAQQSPQLRPQAQQSPLPQPQPQLRPRVTKSPPTQPQAQPQIQPQAQPQPEAPPSPKPQAQESPAPQRQAQLRLQATQPPSPLPRLEPQIPPRDQSQLEPPPPPLPRLEPQIPPRDQPQLEPPPQPQSQLRSEAQLRLQAQQSPPPQPQAQPQAEPQSQPQQQDQPRMQPQKQDQPRMQPPPPGQSYGPLLPNLSPTGPAPKRMRSDREAKQSAESAHRPQIPHHWTTQYKVAASTWTFGDRYGPRKRLGGGAQGDVWTVLDALHERTMVLKTTSCCGHTPHAMLQEIAALRKTLHPNIVCMRDVFFTGQELGYVMDCARMDLRACIRHSRDQFGGVSPEMAKYYVRQVLEGLAYLHEDRGILHLDLKPDNILVERNHHVRIADFGLSRSPGPSGQQRTVVTCEYRPPEVFLRTSNFTYAIDIWSLGVVIQEMIGDVPWRGMHTNPLRCFRMIMSFCGSSGVWRDATRDQGGCEIFPGASELPGVFEGDEAYGDLPENLHRGIKHFGYFNRNLPHGLRAKIDGAKGLVTLRDLCLIADPQQRKSAPALLADDVFTKEPLIIDWRRVPKLK